MRATDTLNNSRNTRAVDFLIAGAQKSGRTALAEYLRRHPDICMPENKELRFFDDERQFAGQAPDYDAYQRCFAPSHDGQVLGEATPTYMFWDAAPERIRAYDPRMKLLLVLRNPIARAFSHWHMEQARGRESMDFGEVIRTEGRRMQDAPQQQRRTYSYVARGFYSRQILRLWSLFPRHQTLIIRNKTLLDAHRDVLALISRFLAIEPFPETGALTAFAQAC